MRETASDILNTEYYYCANASCIRMHYPAALVLEYRVFVLSAFSVFLVSLVLFLVFSMSCSYRVFRTRVLVAACTCRACGCEPQRDDVEM